MWGVFFFHSSANSGLSRFSFCRQANTLPEQKPVFRLLHIHKVILWVPRWQCIKPHGTYRTSFIQKISGSFCKHAWNHLTFLWDVRQALLQLISDRGSQGRKKWRFFPRICGPTVEQYRVPVASASHTANLGWSPMAAHIWGAGQPFS